MAIFTELVDVMVKLLADLLCFVTFSIGVREILLAASPVNGYS